MWRHEPACRDVVASGYRRRVDISTALLCDFAEVREGLLFLVGGPITRLWRAQFPAPMNLCVALVLEGTEGEVAGVPHELNVFVADADGRTHAEARTGIQAQAQGFGELSPGEVVPIPVVIPLLGVPLPGPGTFDVRILLDGGSPLGQPERLLTVRAAVGPPAPQ
jgi:hypothetical protein